jgi:hypothetical protein
MYNYSVLTCAYIDLNDKSECGKYIPPFLQNHSASKVINVAMHDDWGTIPSPKFYTKNCSPLTPYVHCMEDIIRKENQK